MVVALAFVAAMAPPSHTDTFIVGGVKRQAVIFDPSKKSDHPPILFAFHGHGGTMQGSVSLFKMQTLWPNAVVVYPQGLDTPSHTDPAGTKPGWQSAPGDQSDRDVKFFDAMYTKLQQDYSFDRKHVHAMGFSNGAVFTFVLWSTRRAKLASVAEAAGIAKQTSIPLQYRPAFLMAGQKDTTAPYQDQLDTIKYVKQVDGVPSSATGALHNGVRYYSGSSADVAVYIHSGGHLYPATMGPYIVKFFKNHPHP
jgi:polyhydroxybutyrate depolymerase